MLAPPSLSPSRLGCAAGAAGASPTLHAAESTRQTVACFKRQFVLKGKVYSTESLSMPMQVVALPHILHTEFP